MYGSSRFDQWLERQADDHYGCNDDDNNTYSVLLRSPNNWAEQTRFSVYAECIDDALGQVNVPAGYRPRLKNGKLSKAKVTRFAPNENVAWISIGKKTIGTITLED